MTIYDISKKAGVSIATVSRVLNGSDKVRPATRKKVMDIIEKYDYTPNAFARGMGLHSVQTIGILCADSSDLFLAKAVYYLEQELQSNGYESLLCCTGYNLDIKKNYLNLILSKKVDGIILVGSNFIGTNEEENQYIKDVSAQVPIMLLNASFDYPNVYSTLCDDYTSMFEATVSMLDAGIEDILYLYNSNSYSGVKKLGGFRAAMEALLLIVGGSSGSKVINEAVRKVLPELLEQFYIIHLCGKGNLDEKLKGVIGYAQFEYASAELTDMFALADLAISRAGANSICELLALHKPNILIPLSAAASRGDQILNANSFAKQGFSYVIEEEKLTDQTLLDAVREVYADREKYIHTMSESGQMDSIGTILKLIESVSK